MWKTTRVWTKDYNKQKEQDRVRVREKRKLSGCDQKYKTQGHEDEQR